MKVRHVRVILFLCGAILIGVLIAVAPIGGAAAIERSVSRSGFPLPPQRRANTG